MAGIADGGIAVATGFMDSLKQQPLSLALVVMNLALLACGYFLLTTVAAQREREVALMYNDKKEVRELLARCVVPPREQRTEGADQYGPFLPSSSVESKPLEPVAPPE